MILFCKNLFQEMFHGIIYLICWLMFWPAQNNTIMQYNESDRKFKCILQDLLKRSTLNFQKINTHKALTIKKCNIASILDLKSNCKFGNFKL